MTDNEIIEALRCCADRYCKGCSEQGKANCRESVAALAWDLIDRQKAEIKRLKAEINVTKDAYISLQTKIEILSQNADTAFQDGLNEAQDLYKQQIKEEIKAEAIKEFAERLKEKYKHHVLCGYEVINGELDNLVKEMVGEG